MSHEAQDLISKLLHSDPALRLGANGAQDVKSHPFFNGIDWDSLLDDSLPPFVPTNLKPEDTSYFDGNYILFYVISFFIYLVFSL